MILPAFFLLCAFLYGLVAQRFCNEYIVHIKHWIRSSTLQGIALGTVLESLANLDAFSSAVIQCLLARLTFASTRLRLYISSFPPSFLPHLPQGRPLFPEPVFLHIFDPQGNLRFLQLAVSHTFQWDPFLKIISHNSRRVHIEPSIVTLPLNIRLMISIRSRDLKLELAKLGRGRFTETLRWWWYWDIGGGTRRL